MRKLLSGALALILTISFTLPAHAATAPLWETDFKEAVKWTQVTQSGILLAGTNSSLSGVDPDSGAILWTRDDIKKTAPFNTREVTGTPLLIVNDYSGMGTTVNIYAINQLDGTNVWKSEGQQGMPIGVYAFPKQNVVLLFFLGWNKEEGNGTHVQALELTTGKKLWDSIYAGVMGGPVLHVVDDSGWFYKKADLSGQQEPIAIGDYVYIPFKGLDCYNLKTGEKKWSVPFKTGIPLYKKAYPPMVVEGDTIYAGGYGMVYAINKDTGAIQWQSTKISSGQIAELTIADSMLLARVGGFFYEPGSKKFILDKPLAVIAYDKVKGDKLWEYKKLALGITNLLYLPEQKAVILADGQSLIGLDSQSTGKATEKFKVKLEFTRSIGASEAASAGMKVLTSPGIGGLLNAGIGLAKSKANRMDIPVSVSLLENGQVSVRGKQHVMSYDPSSEKILWSNYFPASGSGIFEIAVMSALTFVSAWGTQISYASGSMDRGEAEDNIKKAWDAFDKIMQKRYQASKGNDKKSYILTNVEEDGAKGLGIIAVSLKTGNPDQQFLFNEKQPLYTVDETEGKLFHFKNKTKLEAYAVK